MIKKENLIKYVKEKDTKKKLLFSMKQKNRKNKKNSVWEKIKENKKKCGKIKKKQRKKKESERNNEKELLCPEQTVKTKKRNEQTYLMQPIRKIEKLK